MRRRRRMRRWKRCSGRASEVRSPVVVEGDVLAERSDNLALTEAVDQRLKKKKKQKK